jgi:hypothetical protein
MSNRDFEHFLKDELNKDKSIQPQRELWLGIEKAINHPTTKVDKVSYWPKMSGVAACLFAGLLSWNFMSVQSEKTPLASINSYFEQQKQTLLIEYSAQPALTKDWQSQLNELEQAELAIKQALKNEPDNAALLTMLAQIYQQQLDLINKVHQPRWQQI